VVKKVCLKRTPHFKFAIQYSTVQYSTVQYSTVQYSTVQYWYYRYLNKNLELNKIEFENFFINYQKLKASVTKISVKNYTIANMKI
jgi:hypothetical protein